MKEVTFIRRNIEKWKEAEGVVEQATNSSPDRLADVYTDLLPIWHLRRRISRLPVLLSI